MPVELSRREVKMYLTVLKYLAPVVIVGGILYAAYDYGAGNERKRWETKAYDAVISAHEIAGKFTAGLLSDNKETENDAQIKIEQLQSDLAAADSAADSLREQARLYAKRAADSSRAAANCKATESAIGVLADMHAESDRLAGVYAKQADENRIAGLSCEKAYSDLKKAVIQQL